MITCGVSYKLIPYRERYAGAKGLDVGVAYVVSLRGESGFVRTPQGWCFPAPAIDGFTAERFGASETRGLFGGIQNEVQRSYSEATERALGDVLTCTVCEIVDRDIKSEEATILLLGPAFPKLAGRLASLRLPLSVRVVWVCPKPFPKWIAEGVDDTSVFPRYGHGPARHESWEEESLVLGYEYQLPRRSDRYIVQELQAGKRRGWVDLHPTEWLESNLVKCPIPRELTGAAAVLDEYLKEPDVIKTPEVLIKGSHGNPYWELAPAAEAEHERPFLGRTPGWPIRWLP